jgi:hypothetical protein
MSTYVRVDFITLPLLVQFLFGVILSTGIMLKITKDQIQNMTLY